MFLKIATGGIKIYQLYFRALLPSTCRFRPSCSEYARQAMSKYGVFAGMAKTARRLLSCHPFSGRSGNDPLI